jgi:hypothetical protein
MHAVLMVRKKKWCRSRSSTGAILQPILGNHARLLPPVLFPRGIPRLLATVLNRSWKFAQPQGFCYEDAQ